MVALYLFYIIIYISTNNTGDTDWARVDNVETEVDVHNATGGDNETGCAVFRTAMNGFNNVWWLREHELQRDFMVH